MAADYGFFESIWRELTSGKGTFRLILQPVMSIILGLRLGVADAKEGKEPFLFRLFAHRQERRSVFKESLSDAVLPLCLALVMDAIFQYLTNGRIRPLGAVVVGFILVWLPFTLTRGLTNRIWHHLPARRDERAHT